MRQKHILYVLMDTHVPYPSPHGGRTGDGRKALSPYVHVHISKLSQDEEMSRTLHLYEFSHPRKAEPYEPYEKKEVKYIVLPILCISSIPPSEREEYDSKKTMQYEHHTGKMYPPKAIS